MRFSATSGISVLMTNDLIRASAELDVDKQGIINSLIDSLGIEGLECGSSGIPQIADKDRGLTAEGVVRVLGAVARRAGGATWAELASDGNPWAQINPIAQKSEVLARLLKAGEDAFHADLARRLESRLVERATSPKRRYVVGRVGKDRDGVLRHPDTGELLEVEPDNGKILEFALAKVHPKFRDENKATVDQQNVYNITVIPPPPPAERVVVVDVSGGDGGRNRAEIGGGLGECCFYRGFGVSREGCKPSGA